MQGSPFTRFLAGLCAIAFVLTTVAALLFVSLDRQLLVASTYKNALTSQQVYNRLPAMVAEQLVESLNASPCVDNPLKCGNASPELVDCFKAELGQARYNALASGTEGPTGGERARIQGCVNQLQPDLQSSDSAPAGIPNIFKLIKAADLEKVIAPLLPPDQIKALTDDFLDQFFAYLNGERASITLDLTGIKQDLAGPGGLDTLILIIQAQPACTFEQLGQIVVITLTGQGELILCNPSPELLKLLNPFIKAQLKAAVDLIPDARVIRPLAAQTSPSFGPFGIGPMGAIRPTLLLLRLSPLLALFCLILVTLLAVRSVRDLLRWWGIPLFAAGLLAVVLGLAGSSLFETAWVGLLAGHLPSMLSVDLIGTVHDVVQAVLQTFWRGIQVAGGLVAFVGLGMWIVSMLIRNRAQPLNLPANR